MGLILGSGGSGGRRGRRALNAEINVTPFVDVMLVLLIVFMVTAPLLIRGEDVNLPSTRSAPLKSDANDAPLTLWVRADGTVVDHKSEPTYIEERVKVIGDRTELKGLIGKDGIARKYDSSTGRYFVEFPEWLGARPSASADVPRPGPAVVNYDIHPVDLELVPILSMHAARKQRDRRREQEREREEEEPKDEL